MANHLTKGKWNKARHLRKISDALVEASYGGLPPDCRGLIVSVPPRHGKSELISHWFPVWFLEHFPDKRIMLASYEGNFARMWGAKVRDSIMNNRPKHRAMIHRGSNASSGEWRTIQGGGMISVGAGGSQTGRGADVLLVDDPIKDNTQADSAAWRRRLWGWWETTASTRLEPGGFAVICMTRWHSDDLVGRLLRDMEKGGAQFKVMTFPAICEVERDDIGRVKGEPLWPERYGIDFFEQRQRYKRSWNALYRQQPSDDAGNVFKDTWWKFWRPRLLSDPEDHRDALPTSFDRVIASWDCSFKGVAQKKSKAEDDASGLSWVVGTVWGKKGADVYLLDLVRGHWGFSDTIAQIKAQKAKWPGVQEIFVEDKANGPAIIDTLAQQIPGVVPAQVEGDKVARAHAVTFAIESGNVWLPEHSEWIDAYLSEVSTFPYGTADDQVDSTTQALSKLYSSNEFSFIV